MRLLNSKETYIKKEKVDSRILYHLNYTRGHLEQGRCCRNVAGFNVKSFAI